MQVCWVNKNITTIRKHYLTMYAGSDKKFKLHYMYMYVGFACSIVLALYVQYIEFVSIG